MKNIDFKSAMFGLGIGMLMLLAYASVSDESSDLIEKPTSSEQIEYLPQDQGEKVILWLEQNPQGGLTLNWEKHQQQRPGSSYGLVEPITAQGMMSVQVDVN